MLWFYLHDHILLLWFLSESLKVFFSRSAIRKTESDIMQVGKKGRKEQDVVWLDLMLSDGRCVGSNASACCLSSSCVFFPHVLGENGCSIAIPVLWGMQTLSHLFIVFHITPSQSFPPTAEQQTTLYKVTAAEASECMNKLTERSLLMLNFPLVRIVVPIFICFLFFFFTFSITVDCVETHPSFYSLLEPKVLGKTL